MDAALAAYERAIALNPMHAITHYAIATTAGREGAQGRIDRLREAIAREESGRVVFVSGGLPDETLEVEMTEEKKEFARARVLEVVEASPDRVVPPCPYVEAGCGGCDLQTLEPSAQVRT